MLLLLALGLLPTLSFPTPLFSQVPWCIPLRLFSLLVVVAQPTGKYKEGAVENKIKIGERGEAAESAQCSFVMPVICRRSPATSKPVTQFVKCGDNFVIVFPRLNPRIVTHHSKASAAGEELLAFACV